MFNDDGERYCVFRQASHWYAFPATDVLQVAPVPHIVHVPDADPVLAGLCHSRNEFLPVLRLHSLVGQLRAEDPSEQQLLVMRGSQGPWALLVDRVSGLETLEVSLNYESSASGDWAAAITGSATLRKELVRVLDARRVYSLSESVLQSRWSNADSAPQEISLH